MQTRPYDTDDGLKVWLSRDERRTFLSSVAERPKRELAFRLALHGLRSNEVTSVAKSDFERLDVDGEHYRLIVRDGKTGRRSLPVAKSLRDDAIRDANSHGLGKHEPLVDVGERTLRKWIADAREHIADLHDGGADETAAWRNLRMHDLRRTWATDTFYSLAYEGVPIAEELTMGWGGWTMTSTGRQTFRNSYLGPEPDHITARATSHLQLV